MDDFTRVSSMFLLRRESEKFNCFQIFKELTENEIDIKIKCLRSDNGGEFVSKEFNKYCDDNGNTFLLLKHLNKMVLLKEKIGLLWRWQEQC